MFLFGINFSVSGCLLILFPIFLMVIHYWPDIKAFLIYRKKLAKFAKLLPSPPTLPIIGNAHLVPNAHELVMVLAEYSQKLGKNFCFWLGPLLKVVITDPRDYEIIMNSPLAADKDSIYAFMEPIVKAGLINGRGAKYRAHKKLYMPLVNGKPLPGFCLKFNEQTIRLVKNLMKKSGGGEFDMFEEISLCVADIVWETLYGLAGKVQDGEENEILNLIERGLRLFMKRAFTFWLHPSIIFKYTSTGKNYLQVSDKVHGWFDNLIATKKHQYMQNKSSGNNSSSDLALLDQLLDHIMKTKSWTDFEFRDELITTLIGAHDTITGIATFSVLAIAMHPEVQDKVREEVKNVVGDGIITDEIAGNLKYTEMVMKETIRLFPAGPVLGRTLTGDIKITNGELPKGCSIYMLPYATHRDPDYWPNPETFDPERFTLENSKNRHPYTFLPFSGGLRKCPGYKYGIACVKIIIADIVRNFNLTTTMKLDKMDLDAHISVRCKNGYNLSVTKIDK